MGLLDRIKSLFGGSSENRSHEEVSVTVEREPDDESGGDAAAETGVADEEPDAPDTEDEDESDDDEAEPETDEDADDEAEPAAEEAESEDEEDTEAEPDESASPPGDAAEGPAAESVESISGIGPAYGERLADAGVETVGDLAAADADALAEETDIGAGRIVDWIERAEARLR